MSISFHSNDSPGAGANIGYAELGTNWSSTNTTYGGNTTVALAPGVLVTVTGRGRPVEVQASIPSARHITANNSIGAYILMNGAVYDAGFIVNVSTVNGQQIRLQRLTTNLTAGTAYTFQLGVYASSTGAITLPCLIPDFPISLAVTQR